MAAAAVEAITAAAAVLSAVEENPAADILAACVLLALGATAAAAHPERAAVWAPRGEVRQEEVRARVVLRIFVPPSTTANGIHLLLRTQPVKPSPPTIPEWPTTIGTDLTAPEKPGGGYGWGFGGGCCWGGWAFGFGWPFWGAYWGPAWGLGWSPWWYGASWYGPPYAYPYYAYPDYSYDWSDNPPPYAPAPAPTSSPNGASGNGSSVSSDSPGEGDDVSAPDSNNTSKNNNVPELIRRGET
jgi:hypothetical protein